VVTFNSSDGLSEKKLHEELTPTLNVKQNGTFLGNDLQISRNTDRSQAGNMMKFKGNFGMLSKTPRADDIIP
jgi:hypothetical protein